jgi:DNA-binding MarR family transcriptional regulator
MKLRDEIRQARPFASPAEEAFLNIQRTAQTLAARMAEALKPWDLSPTQYNALRILRGAGKQGLACSEIGARMVTADSDITRLLDRLAKKGLVERARGAKDRRVVVARATPKAQRLLAELDGPVTQFVRGAMQGLSARELRQLNAGLEKLRS